MAERTPSFIARVAAVISSSVIRSAIGSVFGVGGGFGGRSSRALGRENSSVQKASLFWSYVRFFVRVLPVTGEHLGRPLF